MTEPSGRRPGALALLVSLGCAIGILDGCSQSDAGIDAATDSAATSAVITAVDGGVVASDDGIFRIVVPPGALAADTRITVRTIPRAEWPADAAEGEPLASVYAVEPDGLTFLSPAFAVHEWATPPTGVIAADGSMALAVHYALASDGTVEPVETTTVRRRDASVLVIGELQHLSSHWAETHARNLPARETRDVTARVSSAGGVRAVGASWQLSTAQLTTSGPIAILRGSLLVGTSPLQRFIAPVGGTMADPIDGQTIWSPDTMGFVVHEVEFLPAVFTTVPTGVVSPLASPLPGFQCLSAGAAGLTWARVFAQISFGDPSRSFGVYGVFELDDVDCVDLDAGVSGDGSTRLDADRRDGAPDAGSAAADAATDAGPLPDGRMCGAAGECASGLCVDGVCCNEPCAGECQSCSSATSRGPDGTCAPIREDTDPDDECPLLQTCQGATTAYCNAHFGDPCTVSADCVLEGRCIDGVCCNNRNCGGASTVMPCTACRMEYTGMPNGICSAVLPRMDPYDYCGFPGGVCDGAMGCCRDTGTSCSRGGDCCSGTCTGSLCE